MLLENVQGQGVRAEVEPRRGVVRRLGARSFGSNQPAQPPARPVDLRRRFDRKQAEQIVAKAMFLAPSDRALVLAVFRDHVTVEALARAAGTSAPRMRRRLRSLVRRLLSWRFEWALRARHQWAPARRRVAEACYFQGLTQRQIARRFQISLYAVRSHLAALRALEEVAQ